MLRMVGGIWTTRIVVWLLVFVLSFLLCNLGGVSWWGNHSGVTMVGRNDDVTGLARRCDLLTIFLCLLFIDL